MYGFANCVLLLPGLVLISCAMLGEFAADWKVRAHAILPCGRLYCLSLLCCAR